MTCIIRLLAFLTHFLIFTSSFAIQYTALKIAVPPMSPPLTMMADTKGHFSGFSIELMDAICTQMKVRCVYQLYGFEDTFNVVMRGAVDLAVGNLTITKDREQYVSFSLSYLPSFAQFVTLQSSTVKSIAQLKDKKVGAERNGLYVDYVKTQFALSDDAVLTYPNPSDIMLALNEGTIDAAILDKETAESWYANNNNLFALLGSPISIGLGFGLMSAKENTDLIQQVNAALLLIEANGQYSKIYSTYFFDTPPAIGSKP